jgi:hypothetical protein
MSTTTKTAEALAALLDEVRKCFTRDDDLPGELLPRIDEALATQAAGEPIAPHRLVLTPADPTTEMQIAGFESAAWDALITAVCARKGWPYSCRESAECVAALYKSMLDGRPSVAYIPSEAAHDVLAERQRQVAVEGWTPKHDDRHADGSLALAAACYARNAATWAHRPVSIPASEYVALSEPGMRWPWHMKWWKPKSQRQDLVRAAALILAEIERLDRAATKAGQVSFPAPSADWGTIVNAPQEASPKVTDPSSKWPFATPANPEGGEA